MRAQRAAATKLPAALLPSSMDLAPGLFEAMRQFGAFNALLPEM